MSCESRFLEAAKAIAAAQPNSGITAKDLAMAFHLRQAKIDPKSLEAIMDVAGIAVQDEVTVEDGQGDHPLSQFAADKNIKLKQVRSQVRNFQAQREKEEALADGTPLVIFGQGGEDCLRFFTGDDLEKWIDEAKFDKSGKQIKRFGNYSVVLECSDKTEDRFVLDVIEGKKVLASYSGDTREDLWRDTGLPMDIAVSKARMARNGKKRKSATGKIQHYCDQCHRPMSRAVYQRGQGLCFRCID